MRTIAVWILCLIVHVPAFGSDRPAGDAPLTIDERGGLFVDVRIDGAGPFQFILDTGATRSMISDALAREIGAPRVARSAVVTSGGTEFRPVVRLGTLVVAGARADALLAPVVEDARLAALGRDVRGLLGQDFLSAFDYTIDYRHRRLTWDAGPAGCACRNAVKLLPSEGRFVMDLVGEESTSLRLVPDSGAETLVLFGGDHRVLSGPQVLVSTVAGNRPAHVTRVPRLHIGSIVLRDLTAVIVDRREPGVDGLMPLHGFSSVSFAAGGACLVARP